MFGQGKKIPQNCAAVPRIRKLCSSPLLPLPWQSINLQHGGHTLGHYVVQTECVYRGYGRASACLSNLRAPAVVHRPPTVPPLALSERPSSAHCIPLASALLCHSVWDRSGAHPMGSVTGLWWPDSTGRASHCYIHCTIRDPHDVYVRRECNTHAQWMFRAEGSAAVADDALQRAVTWFLIFIKLDRQMKWLIIRLHTAAIAKITTLHQIAQHKMALWDYIIQFNSIQLRIELP